MKLRAKILILITIALTAAFSVMSFYLINNGVKDLRTQLDESSKAFASLSTAPIGEAYKEFGESGQFRVRTAVLSFSELQKEVENIQIVNTKGKTLFSLDDDKDLTLTEEEATTFKPIYRYNQNGTISYIINPYFENFGIRSYSMVYKISSASIDRATKNVRISFIYFSSLALVGTLLIVYLFLNFYIIKPVRKMSQQARDISDGKYETLIRIKRRDELGELASSVSHMAESLKGNIDQLQQLDKTKSEFMMITSHNLRTPLTIINGYLDSLNGSESVEDLMEVLKHVAESTRRLRGFSEDMLTISKFEMGGADTATENGDLTSLMRNVRDDFSDLAKEKEILFEAMVPEEEMIVNINRAQMRAAIWNILDNAYKFTPQGGRIALRGWQRGGNVMISVSDTGIGIPDKERPKLFTKFHRGTGTLTYNYEGTGIGLYLTKLIIDKHNGTIDVESELGRGTTITVTLKAATPAPATKAVTPEEKNTTKETPPLTAPIADTEHEESKEPETPSVPNPEA